MGYELNNSVYPEYWNNILLM